MYNVGGWLLEQRGNSTNAKVERVMATMGFSSEDSSRHVGAFSGGWKMRIALAKVLLQDPNILMLDEPTNHLDLESVEWLESFLVEQKIPMVVISHDREFLNRVSNKIVEVVGGRTFTYHGDYNSFVKQREDRFHAWTKQYEQQQRRIQVGIGGLHVRTLLFSPRSYLLSLSR
jgi:ATP-binding cassette subfamily F protein 3